MWALLVVFDLPPVNGLSDVFQAQEQVLVEQLFPEGAVEAFDIGILTTAPTLSEAALVPLRAVRCMLRRATPEMKLPTPTPNA